MENIFEPILDRDEKIVKIFKPHKGKTFLSIILGWLFCWVWLLFPVIFGLITDVDGNFIGIAWWIPTLAALGVVIVFMVLSILFASLTYKNTYYAYTNKRVIIRKGIFGVDYKSLDMSMIGAVTVNVSVLDKIMAKNTGTIAFGSMASPIGGQTGFMFRFANITMPYETYKEIKNVIDDKKSEKEKNA